MIYFLSDVHLGSLLIPDQREHEKKVVRLLDEMKQDATIIFLLGDIFDFWFEYSTVVPKGYTRLFGKIAELTDAGIEVHFFIGNHDLWTFGYFEKELGMKVHYHPEVMELMGKQFFLAHGDGLSSGDAGFTLLRQVFHSRFAQRLFAMVHPYIGQNLGFAWSRHNRLSMKSETFMGEENERLISFAKEYTAKQQIDFLVFGHRHVDLKLLLRNNAELIILGDFIKLFSYGKFDGNVFELLYFEQ
jgi:UDP-2,3-diacylglucosamine hydrolase